MSMNINPKTDIKMTNLKVPVPDNNNKISVHKHGYGQHEQKLYKNLRILRHFDLTIINKF
jgi:hypothetical protein